MKIVGISACTAGIAHTYMAQEALEQECKKRGIDCKIETQGGMGIDNELSQEEIDAADVVILAVAVSVEMSERFDSKRAAGRVLDVTPGDAIKKTAELIDRAESIAALSAPEAVQTKSSAARSARSASEEKTSLGAELFRYFNTGISYFLPVIIAGGMLFSFTLITGTVEDGRIIPSSQFWQNVYDLGMAGFSMMVPVLCAYIAYAIGSKAAIAPGFILGHAANTPMGESHIATGFLGALLLGFLVGYFVRWLKKFPVPDVLQPMMPTFLIPLFTTLILGLFYIYLLTVPLNAFVQFMIQVMYQLNGAGAMALGIGIGLLAAADFGGACSKAATAFTLALMAEGILGPNGVFRMCCAIPPSAWASPHSSCAVDMTRRIASSASPRSSSRLRASRRGQFPSPARTSAAHGLPVRSAPPSLEPSACCTASPPSLPSAASSPSPASWTESSGMCWTCCSVRASSS